jgi:hypothetical protein
MKCYFGVSAYEKDPVTKVRKLGELFGNTFHAIKLPTIFLAVYPDYLRILTKL